MSYLQRVIHREMKSREPFITGTAIGTLRMEYGDDGGGVGDASPVWVQDFDIGSNRPLTSVVVKSGSTGSRAYAKQGMSCLLHWQAFGRYVCVGPADQVTSEMEIRYYDYSGTQTGAESKGFTFIRHAFEDYKHGGSPTYWGDGIHPMPWVDIVDADGNPV